MFPKLKNQLYRWLGNLATTRLDGISSLQRVSRDGYKYIENDHELLIQVEMQSGNPDYFVYTSTLHSWLPPYEQEPITVEKKQQILEKLYTYLNSRKVSYEIR